MAKSAPKIDRRTAAEIVANVHQLLAKNLPQEFPESEPLKGFNLALVNIFARYCEIIIQRLNRVPEKNFLTFLDTIGASPLPQQPARVPLTFTLAAGSGGIADRRSPLRVGNLGWRSGHPHPPAISWDCGAD